MVFLNNIKIKIKNWFFNCAECNGTSKIMGMGHIEHDCHNKICKTKMWFWRRISALLSWLLGNPFKTTPILLALIFSCLLISHDLFINGRISTETLIISFGWIFAASTYKLNQATYHKNLFDERYKVYAELLDVLTHYAQEMTVSKEMYIKVSNIDLSMKGRFLFGRETRDFIDKFKSSIIKIHYGLKSDGEVKEQMRLKAEEARNFLNPLIDGYNFAEKFKELDISIY